MWVDVPLRAAAGGGHGAVTEPGAIIIAVDDDVSVRRGLEHLLRAAGDRAQTYSSAEESLAGPPIAGPCCLVLDVRMPAEGGLDLYQR